MTPSRLFSLMVLVASVAAAGFLFGAVFTAWMRVVRTYAIAVLVLGGWSMWMRRRQPD